MTPSQPESGAFPAPQGPGILPLLPTREMVVFPRMVAPLYVGREKSVNAIERAFNEKTPIILSAQRQPAVEEPDVDEIMPIGTRAKILQLFRLPDGSIKALVEGQERVRIERFESISPHFVVRYTPLQPTDRSLSRSRALARRVAQEFAAYVQLNPQIADDVQYVVSQAEDPEDVADIVAAHLQVSAEEKQALLTMESTQERLTALLESLAEETEVLGLEQEIMTKVAQRIEKAQRQVLLHEKMRVIRDEIAEAGEEPDEEAADYAARLAAKDLAPAARTLVERELRKLRQAPAMSPEVAVVRLPRHDPRPSLGGTRQGRGRRRRGSRTPRAHAPWPQGRQGPHPRVPCRCSHACRRGAGRRARRALRGKPARHDPLPRRPSRDRQEQRGTEHRRRARPAVRAHRPGRRP